MESLLCSWGWAWTFYHSALSPRVLRLPARSIIPVLRLFLGSNLGLRVCLARPLPTELHSQLQCSPHPWTSAYWKASLGLWAYLENTLHWATSPAPHLRLLNWFGFPALCCALHIYFPMYRFPLDSQDSPETGQFLPTANGAGWNSMSCADNELQFTFCVYSPLTLELGLGCY